jgi:hypothetical protein
MSYLTRWDGCDTNEIADVIQGLREQVRGLLDRLDRSNATTIQAEQRALMAEADTAQMRRERDAAAVRVGAACQDLHDLADWLDDKGLAADAEDMPALGCALVLASNRVRNTLAKIGGGQ